MHPKQFTGHAGLRLAADVGGDPVNPPAILLHGGGQTRFSWGETAEALADNGFYVVSLDLRGHGESEWSPQASYAMENYAADLRSVCATLGRPAALIGASLGGLASLLAAGESSLPIASALILVDVAPKINIEAGNDIHRFMLSAPNGFTSVEDAADAVAAYLPHRSRPTDTSGLMRNLRERDGRLYWHWDPQMAVITQTSVLRGYERLAAAARKISAPTLLIRGGNSELVTDESVKDFLELVPSAEYTVIKGAQHMVAGDRNTAFSSAVIEFMQRRVDHGVVGHVD
jgi:non-heme chloroperoxidase